MRSTRPLALLVTWMAACGGGGGGGDGSGQDGGGADGDGGVGGDALRTRVSPELPVIGAAVAVDPLADDAGYAELAGSEFNSLTPENAMKCPTSCPPG